MPQSQGGRRRRRRNIMQEIEEALVLANDSHDEHEQDAGQEGCCVWERWKALSGEYETTCKLFSTDKDEHICAIMHEPTSSATVDNLPVLWPVTDKCGANTVELECLHTFYAPALAFHFLVKDMRCPVCRCGCHEQMQLSSVPASVRAVYAAKMQALQQNTLQEELTNISPVQIGSVLSELELEMCILGPHAATARTRVLFEQEHVLNIYESLRSTTPSAQIPMTTNFAVHRSFQRLVQSIVARHYFVNAGGAMRFALTHPLLPVSFRSHELSIIQAWVGYFTADAPAVMPLFCNTVAGSEPVGFVRSVYCATSNTCSITVDMNVHIIINILSYVNDVLDSIRNSVEQHLSLQLPTIAFVRDEAELDDRADDSADDRADDRADHDTAASHHAHAAGDNYQGVDVNLFYGMPD